MITRILLSSARSTLFRFPRNTYIPLAIPKAFSTGTAVPIPTSLREKGIARIVPAKPVIP